ncbi:MAG: outer membrane beta-barrel protein [Flavobacteriales bacterium]
MHRLSLLIGLFFTAAMQLNAQVKWTLHAETGLNKQDVSAVTNLVQQNELNPKAYWKFAASGGLELSYTMLKFATVFTGLGYVKTNGRYVTSQNALNPDGSLQGTYTSDKLTTADMISLPVGLQINILKLHLGGGIECRYRVAGSLTTHYSSIAAYASNSVDLGTVVGPNTNAKLDYGYFAYASFNFTKRFGCKISYYEGQRDLSNGYEFGAWKEWMKNVGNSIFSLNNKQMTIGLYLKIN